MKSELEGYSKKITVEQQQSLTGVSPPILERSLLDRIEQVSPAALAYLGDAVYELYVRAHYLLPPKRLQVYHQQVVAQVRAEAQANYLRSLQPHLTDTEREVLRQGRNAASGGPKRVSPVIYQQATSFETLLGYLYLTDPERLVQLCSTLAFDPPDI